MVALVPVGPLRVFGSSITFLNGTAEDMDTSTGQYEAHLSWTISDLSGEFRAYVYHEAGATDIFNPQVKPGQTFDSNEQFSSNDCPNVSLIGEKRNNVAQIDDITCDTTKKVTVELMYSNTTVYLVVGFAADTTEFTWEDAPSAASYAGRWDPEKEWDIQAFVVAFDLRFSETGINKTDSATLTAVVWADFFDSDSDGVQDSNYTEDANTIKGLVSFSVEDVDTNTSSCSKYDPSTRGTTESCKATLETTDSDSLEQGRLNVTSLHAETSANSGKLNVMASGEGDSGDSCDSTCLFKLPIHWYMPIGVSDRTITFTIVYDILYSSPDTSSPPIRRRMQNTEEEADAVLGEEAKVTMRLAPLMQFPEQKPESEGNSAGRYAIVIGFAIFGAVVVSVVVARSVSAVVRAKAVIRAFEEKNATEAVQASKSINACNTHT